MLCRMRRAKLHRTINVTIKFVGDDELKITTALDRMIIFCYTLYYSRNTVEKYGGQLLPAAINRIWDK